jgi:hypothetical protein
MCMHMHEHSHLCVCLWGLLVCLYMRVLHMKPVHSTASEYDQLKEFHLNSSHAVIHSNSQDFMSWKVTGFMLWDMI